jgi:hypothetical protein
MTPFSNIKIIISTDNYDPSIYEKRKYTII